MLTGNIFKSMVLFAIPIFFSSVFQQLYNTVDTIIIGHTLGENALAAVGAATPVYSLLMGFALGIGNGVSIVTARSFGAKEEDRIKSSVAASIFIGIAISIIITSISLLFLMPFLKIMNTPAEILDSAYGYALIISSILNIFLDFFFILALNMGVQGAAAATIVSQTVSVILCILYIAKRVKMLVPSCRHFRYDQKLYEEMLTQGLSMAFMHCFVAAGSTILQAGINSPQNTPRNEVLLLV